MTIDHTTDAATTTGTVHLIGEEPAMPCSDCGLNDGTQTTIVGTDLAVCDGCLSANLEGAGVPDSHAAGVRDYLRAETSAPVVCPHCNRTCRSADDLASHAAVWHCFKPGHVMSVVVEAVARATIATAQPQPAVDPREVRYLAFGATDLKRTAIGSVKARSDEEARAAALAKFGTTPRVRVSVEPAADCTAGDVYRADLYDAAFLEHQRSFVTTAVQRAV